MPERIPIINSPRGLRTVNEKIWATRFPNLVPQTAVTRHKDDFLRFLRNEKDIVVKPTNGFGGMSVFRLKEGDQNAPVTFETLSKGGGKEVVLQKYIPEAEKGDKRVLLLDGNPLGAVLRVHSSKDHRNNFYAGGRAEPTELTPRDCEIIQSLGPELRRLGLTFVGIDIVGDHLTEVNVTSPTCLQEMNALYGKNLEDRVIEFAEQLVQR